MQKRRSDSGVSQSVSAVSLTCRMAKMFPELAKFVLSPVYEDASERQTGTAMFLCEDGLCKIWLHDRDAGMSCFVSGKSLEAACVAAEAAIDGSGGEWRPYKAKRGGRGG